MTGPLTPAASVCALIPHWGCEQWLGQAIESLLEQTRPLDAIVVIDDGSEKPPVDIVARYEGVTLLGAPDNGGPYRLVQAVVDATSHDAYLFQDADDWSAPDRLEVLLATGEATGAELVGSHEVRVLADEGDVVEVRYPLDVNAALRERPASFPLLHPTSVVSGELLRRLGGFATGMRFSGDAELLRRAGHVARIVNADHAGYFRRKRRGSLTLGSDTALGSPARQAVQDVLAERALANAAQVAAGMDPELRPWRTAPPVALTHLAGPPPNETSKPRRPARPRPHSRAGAYAGPVLVVGAPRSGHTVLGWALGQHPALELVTDARWLARAAADIEARATEEAAPVPADFRDALGGALAELLQRPGGGRPVAAATELLPAAHALTHLLPGARFVHVVRDVDDTVAALATAPTAGGAFHTGEQAWRAWYETTEQGLTLEQALGPDRVLRLRYRDLVDDPHTAVRRCLDFLGEASHSACTRPLADLVTDPDTATPTPTVDPALAGRARALSRLVNGDQPPVDPAARRLLAERFHRDARRHSVVGESMVERVRALVAEAVPEGATVAVVSRGDQRLLDLDGRTGWHLPQVEDGTYAGYHPADSAEAVAHLTQLRQRGADHLMVPASGLWWLTWYDRLRDHLARSATLVAFHEEVGAVYRMHAPLPVAAPSPADATPAPPRFVAAAATTAPRVAEAVR